MKYAPNLDFLPTGVGEEHRVISGVAAGKTWNAVCRLDTAVDLASADANAQQEFDERRHRRDHMIEPEQNQTGLQIGAGARTQHWGAEQIDFSNGYVLKPVLNAVLFLFISRH